MTSTDLVNELQAQLTSDTLLIILVDSSESVAASYPTIVTGILPLILEKTPGMIRSIIEFGTAVKTVCAFTKNSTVLMNAVKGTNVMIPHPKFPHDRSKDVKRNPGMTHMGGGSNLAEGLTTCMWALLGSDMPKTAIILITNGEPSSDISKAYRSLMDLRPVLIAVGVGHGVEEHKFASLLPDAHRFLSRDYTGLLSTLQALRPIMPKFEITCRQIGTTLQNTTDPVVLEVVISPLLINGVVPAGTVLHFLPGFYLDEVVKTTADAYRERPFETTVTLKPGRWASYKGLVPEKVRYECFMDGTKYTGYVPLLLGLAPWRGLELSGCQKGEDFQTQQRYRSTSWCVDLVHTPTNPKKKKGVGMVWLWKECVLQWTGNLL
ncbi:hypothetical protein Pelo_6044 [Pelomyxa schiedti]|nr:hypothetical protein Pelo_6044 [Pelomyxa schiedti]